MSASPHSLSDTRHVSAPPTGAVRKTPTALLFQAIPTVLVVALLAAVAWFGHRTGWKLPRARELWGAAPRAEEEFCEEHNVPEAMCVECQPELSPHSEPARWCKEHELPECTLCQPELAQLKSTPTISETQKERAKAALEFTARPQNSRQCKLHERHIQFSSQAAVERAGIDIAPVWEAPMVEAVSASGEIGYDETHLAHLASRATGTVWRAIGQVGDKVQRGDLLALVDSTEVGRTKSEYLQAVAQKQLRQKLFDSMRPAFDRGAVPELKFRETEAAFQEAAIRLTTAEQALVNLGLPVKADELANLAPEELARRVKLLGLPTHFTATLDPQTTTANLFPLKAPLDGVIVERDVVVGEVVGPTQVLFTVADISRMWLELELRIEDAQDVRPGQTIRFLPDGMKREVKGTLSWISTAVKEKTRTVQARAELDNPEGRLRAGTFGRGRVILREEPKAIVVPNEAVQWEGDCHVVFVRDKDFLERDDRKLFHVRKVRLGARDEKHAEIIAGVLPGEIVATTGSAILRAQLLKSNLGAGCGHCH
ncbi:MAG: efflux RND transporter periplasmic adaptor subunit [Planctomycetaceae bacterium]